MRIVARIKSTKSNFLDDCERTALNFLPIKKMAGEVEQSRKESSTTLSCRESVQQSCGKKYVKIFRIDLNVRK